MPSALDLAFDKHLAALTAPGGPLETVEVERGGRSYPAFAKAPPSLAHYFAHYCAQHGDTCFLVDGDTRVSFAESFAIARRLAQALIARHGVERGDRIGLAARNSANWVLGYMAIVMAGGCATLLNGWGTGEDLAEGIRLAGCRLALADPQRAARLEGKDCGAPIVAFSHGGGPAEGFGDLLEGAEGTELPQLGPGDLATILFTSGSTGTAKGVLSDHRGVINATINFAAQTLMVLGQMTEAGEAPKHPPAALVPVPLFHVTGEVPIFLQSFALGRKLVMMPKWDPLEAMRLIEAETVTYFVGVPLMSHEIATHPERARFDLSSCTTFAAGGAPRPAAHVGQIREALPASYPVIGYGLTETNAVGCGNFNQPYQEKPASTGRPSRPLSEVGILDPEGNPLAPGETGEIAIRSICNMLRYWEDPEATDAAFTPDGWLLTGDLGYMDEDGYVFIVDRKKDIIIRGGENISCTELEQAIYAHPDVIECSAFGLPDARLGEVPAAVFRPRPARDVTADDLREFLAERLASFKIPQHLWRVEDELPRLATQKVDRRTLRNRYLELSGNR